MIVLRVLVFALLAANLGYCAWSLSQPSKPVIELPPPPPGVKPLVLIREREEQLLREGGDLGSGMDSDCYALGPFQTQADVRRVANAMATTIAQSRQRQEMQTLDRGFWVYLPAVATREDALNLARELSAAGLKDYYVVTAGDRENTVSLGLFKEETNAVRRQAALQALGFDAQITRRREEALVYYFDYRRAEGVVPPWERVVASNSAVTHRPIPCFR